MAPHRLYAHGLPQQLAPNIWQVVGALPFPLPRNMTVVRLADGGLLLYSVVAMDDAGMAALEALGTPRYMVIPSPFHTMDALFYTQRYPALRVVACADARPKLDPGIQVHGAPEAVLPALGIQHRLSVGLKVSEILLDLDTGKGRAWVFSDLFGVTPPEAPFVIKLVGAPRGAGLPRIVKLRQVQDKQAVRTLFEELARTPQLHMLLCSHGPAVTQGASAALNSAAARV